MLDGDPRVALGRTHQRLRLRTDGHDEMMPTAVKRTREPAPNLARGSHVRGNPRRRHHDLPAQVLGRRKPDRRAGDHELRPRACANCHLARVTIRRGPSTSANLVDLLAAPSHRSSNQYTCRVATHEWQHARFQCALSAPQQADLMPQLGARHDCDGEPAPAQQKQRAAGACEPEGDVFPKGKWLRPSAAELALDLVEEGPEKQLDGYGCAHADARSEKEDRAFEVVAATTRLQLVDLAPDVSPFCTNGRSGFPASCERGIGDGCG